MSLGAYSRERERPNRGHESNFLPCLVLGEYHQPWNHSFFILFFYLKKSFFTHTLARSPVRVRVPRKSIPACQCHTWTPSGLSDQVCGVEAIRPESSQSWKTVSRGGQNPRFNQDMETMDITPQLATVSSLPPSFCGYWYNFLDVCRSLLHRSIAESPPRDTFLDLNCVLQAELWHLVNKEEQPEVQACSLSRESTEKRLHGCTLYSVNSRVCADAYVAANRGRIYVGLDIIWRWR